MSVFCGSAKTRVDRQLIRALARLFVIVSVAATFLPEVGTAQPDGVNEVSVRGFQFDPKVLEAANPDEITDFGLDPEGLAGVPTGDDVAHWRVLQFVRPLDRDLRRQLRADGLLLNIYIGRAYVEKVSLRKVRELKQAQLLRASTLYFPEFKLAQSLRGAQLHEDREFETAERRQVEGMLLRATAFPDAEVGVLETDLDAVGTLDLVRQDSRDIGGSLRLLFRLDLDGADLESALKQLSRIEGIQSIEEVGEIVMLNAAASSINQSGDSTDPSIWNQGITGTGQVISIFDRGTPDIDHCLFRDPAIPGNAPGTGHRKVLNIRDNSGYNPYGPDHATYVGANAAGDHDEMSGAHERRGGAFGARLVFTNVYDFAIPGTSTSDLFAELDAAKTNARIFSNSWDEKNTGYSEMARDFDDFLVQNEDVIIVAAGGTVPYNWGPPALSKNTLTVTAYNSVTMQVCDGYGFGPASGRQKPDLTAVGAGLKVAEAGSACNFVDGSCATSYAAPHASAMAALARQYFVGGWYSGGAIEPSGALIKAVLIHSGQDISGIPDFPNEKEGWGALTLDESIRFGSDADDLWIHDIRNNDPDALDFGDSPKHYDLEITSTDKPLKVTLVWSDPPVLDGSDSLSSHLNLEVEAPDGGLVYLGNQIDPATGESVPGGVADDLNNVEQVFIRSPAPGSWTVRVIAGEIGKVEADDVGQGYALVATATQTGKTPLSLVVFSLIVLGLLTLVAVMMSRRRRPSQPEPLRSASGQTR